MLTEQQLQDFRDNGHLTVSGVFSADRVAAALKDVDRWGEAFLAELSPEKRKWYLESGGQAAVLRKLDNPVFERPVFRDMAKDARLVEMVEQLIGSGVFVCFSQVFCKPPEVGGPKPVHQDNFYFGPDNLDHALTVWIALDEATESNGCLYYANGSHKDVVYAHVAPEGEPFNLQIPADITPKYTMTPAPVPPGGISVHHGNTWHQSSSNLSTHPRRAVAFHYMRNGVQLTNAALEYDMSVAVSVT